MNPGRFQQVNATLTAPKSLQGCGDLPVFTDGEVIISRWTPTWRERIAVALGCPAWLYVFARSTQPPVSLVINRDIFAPRKIRRTLKAWAHDAAVVFGAWWSGKPVVRVVSVPDPDRKPGTPRLKVMKGGKDAVT